MTLRFESAAIASRVEIDSSESISLAVSGYLLVENQPQEFEFLLDRSGSVDIVLFPFIA
jgi:hypothetical protein